MVSKSSLERREDSMRDNLLLKIPDLRDGRLGELVNGWTAHLDRLLIIDYVGLSQPF